jgi:hypothetical protein
MRGAAGVKIAVFRKGRAGSEFFRAAAHAHVGLDYGRVLYKE